MLTQDLLELKITDDVYFLHPEQGWLKTFVISKVRKNNNLMVLLAGYGPPVIKEHLMKEEEYFHLVKSEKLHDYTLKIQQLAQ